MATIKAKTSGYWSSATTWSGGILPGTGDTLDLFGFAVTERDNRQILKITNGSSVHEATFIIDGTVLATPVTLTFDDANGAGFGTTNGRRVGFRVKASAGNRATIKSLTSNPANRWTLPYAGSPTWHLHNEGVRNCDLKDFASAGLPITQATPADPWATFSTCNFLGNGTQIDMYMGNRTRFMSCVFNNIRVLRPGAQGWYSFFSGASFTNGGTFGIVASANAGIMASRDHDRVTGQYRMWVSQGAVGRAVMSEFLQADRPISTDKVRIISSSCDLTFDPTAAPVVNGLDLYDVGAILRIPDGIETIVRGTFTQRTGFLDLATTGRLINHATNAATFSLWCGSSVNKSALVEDFGASNNVRLYQGRLVADEAISHGTMMVDSCAVLSVNPGITHTIGAGKMLRAMSSNAIEWNGTPASPIVLQSSVPGSPWFLNVQRGRTLASNGISNYAIQPIQHPIASAMGGKTHFGFFNAAGMESGLFTTRPLVRWRIGTFDESTASWTFNHLDLNNDAEGDGHKFVSLIHNQSGILQGFYDAHIETLKQRRSTASNSAVAWISQASLWTDATYPSVARPPQSTVLYLTWRENGEKDGRFSKSVDGGLTWAASLTLAHAVGSSTFTRCYPLSALAASGSQTLHFAGSWRASDTLPAGARRDSNPWYMTSPDGGTTWKNAGGTTLTLPVGYAEAGSFRVFSGFDAYSDGVAVTSMGIPHTIYHRGSTSATPTALWHAAWDATTSSWIRTKISGAGQWVFGLGAPSAKIAIDAEDIIHIAWTYSTRQMDGTLASFAVTGDLYFMYSRSADGGLTWTNQTLYTIPGPALVPQYINIFCDRITSRTHIFWNGSPAGNSTDGQGVRGVLWEEANALRPMRVTGVSVSDSSATGALVPPFASDSIDGGGNSGWIFRNRLPMPLVPTRIARKYRMYKHEVV